MTQIFFILLILDKKKIDLESVSEHLMNVQECCNANKVTINLQKTNYMIMKSKGRSIDKKGSVRISRSDIKEVSVASFVGIEIACHLSWKEHIQTINKCIRKKVGILFKLRHFVPKNILVLLYKAFIQPHLSYGVEVWGSTYKSNLNCIYLSQKMAMRAITLSPLRTDSRALFQSLNILNIFQLHELLVSTFMYDLVKGVLPHSLVDYCQMIQHRYAIRRKESGLLYQPKCKTMQRQFCISFVGTKLWNDLPDEIRLKHRGYLFGDIFPPTFYVNDAGSIQPPSFFLLFYLSSFYICVHLLVNDYSCLKLLQDLCMYAHLYDIIFFNTSFSFLRTH